MYSFSDSSAVKVIAEGRVSSLCWISGPCGVSVTYTDFCGYGRDMDFCGRKKREGDNPYGLSITDIQFYVYVSPDFLIHLWPFGFFKL